jgi:6-phosphogluconolactonase
MSSEPTGGAVPTLAFGTGSGSTPTSITVDPSGKFALVADSGNGFDNGNVLVYKIDQALGTLTPASGSPFVTSATVPGNATSGVTVDPSDLYAFATNQFVPSLAGFNFNVPANSGNLTQLAPWETATGANPVWVTVDPLDRFVYVSNSSDGTISAWTLGTGGALTAIAGSPFATALNANTGAIAIDPSGRFLYVTDSVNNQLVAFTIDPATGVLAAMAGSPFATDAQPYPVSVDPSGHFVYVGNTALGTISMFTADPNTGALTPVNGSPLTYGGTGANAIVIE